MSRTNELKKQHPDYALSMIDILKMSIPGQSSKYIELLLKLTNATNNADNYNEEHKAWRLEKLKTRYDVDSNLVENMPMAVIEVIYHVLEDTIGPATHSIFRRFCELNERGLIEDNDVSKYSTLEQISQVVALAELKLVDKEAAKKIKVIFEDDIWIVLRPLSLEASQKYGAATKWCTTSATPLDTDLSDFDPYYHLGSHFDRYSYRGILIYTINKKTGHKVGTFKNLNPDKDSEFSFWNEMDDRIDSLDSELPIEILGKIKEEVTNFPITNYAVAGKDDYTKHSKKQKPKTKSPHITPLFEAIPVITPQSETMEALRRMLWALPQNEPTDEPTEVDPNATLYF